MPISEARKRANAKYNAKAYDRIELKVSKGKKEKIRLYAESQGESINAFINRASAETMGEVPKKETAQKRQRKELAVELL